MFIFVGSILLHVRRRPFLDRSDRFYSYSCRVLRHCKHELKMESQTLKCFFVLLHNEFLFAMQNLVLRRQEMWGFTLSPCWLNGFINGHCLS